MSSIDRIREVAGYGILLASLAIAEGCANKSAAKEGNPIITPPTKISQATPILTRPAVTPVVPSSIDPEFLQNIFPGYDYVATNPTGAFGVREYKNQPKGSGEFTHFIKRSIFSRQNNILDVKTPFPPGQYASIAFRSLLTYTDSDHTLLLSLLVGNFATKTSNGGQILMCDFDTHAQILLIATYHNFQLDRMIRVNGHDYDLTSPPCK